MPIFDYRCEACERSFELIVLSSDDEEVCPHCGSRDLAKLASATAPPPRAPGLLKTARKQAAKEGHFSHYSSSEKSKV